MGIAERIYEIVKNMPEPQAASLLDFAEYVIAKHPAPPKTMTLDESKALCKELQALVEAQPMQTESAGDFIRRMRDEARY
ncbi:MAG: hypothetical protein PHE55_22000 [Methylococcaceae bacterium]|nr:hypothetical protein [Methylococcaceae bacterium]